MSLVNNRGTATISDECLSGMIFSRTQFPGAEINGFVRDPERGVFYVYFCHPDLPEVKEGDVNPSIKLIDDASEPARDADGNSVQG